MTDETLYQRKVCLSLDEAELAEILLTHLAAKANFIRNENTKKLVVFDKTWVNVSGIVGGAFPRYGAFVQLINDLPKP